MDEVERCSTSLDWIIFPVDSRESHVDTDGYAIGYYCDLEDMDPYRLDEEDGEDVFEE